LGVWQVFYEGRDMRNKKVHPATFPIALSSKVISLFTHEGELVLDPFVGSGTTLVSARDLNRNAVGFDLKQEYVDVCNENNGGSATYKWQYEDGVLTFELIGEDLCDGRRNTTSQSYFGPQ